MRIEIQWWQRGPIRASLVMRDYRAALLVLIGYALIIVGLFTVRTVAQLSEYFAAVVLIYSFLLGFPAFTANYWQTVLLSAERVGGEGPLAERSQSHAAVLEIYLESELGNLRNQLLSAHSNRLPVDLDEPRRERALDLVTHTLRLFLSDLKLRTAGKKRVQERKKYADDFRGTLSEAATPTGGVIDFLASFYDSVSPNLSAEAKIWMQHGSFWDAVERHPTLVRILELTAIFGVVLAALLRFGALPFLSI